MGTKKQSLWSRQETKVRREKSTRQRLSLIQPPNAQRVSKLNASSSEHFFMRFSISYRTAYDSPKLAACHGESFILNDGFCRKTRS